MRNRVLVERKNLNEKSVMLGFVAIFLLIFASSFHGGVALAEEESYRVLGKGTSLGSFVVRGSVVYNKVFDPALMEKDTIIKIENVARNTDSVSCLVNEDAESFLLLHLFSGELIGCEIYKGSGSSTKDMNVIVKEPNVIEGKRVPFERNVRAGEKRKGKKKTVDVPVEKSFLQQYWWVMILPIIALNLLNR